MELFVERSRAGAILVPLPAVEAKSLTDRNTVRLALRVLLLGSGGSARNLPGVRKEE